MANCNGRQMSLDFGLDNPNEHWKLKNRWLFGIANVSGGEQANIPALPPKKGGRPKLSFKEITAEHLIETISFPGKVEWNAVDLTLYDLRCNQNQVFLWLQSIYDPKNGVWKPSVGTPNSLKRTGILTLYNGAGVVIERWQYDNCWPTSIDWGDLDMESSEILTVDISIKYDRAYFMTN